MPKKHCDLYFNEPIIRWDEAMPLGNGLIGCLVWGPPDALRFSLDRTDLWDNAPFPERQDPGFTYRNMVKLARSHDTEGLRRLFLEPMLRPAPTKLPAGRIILRLGRSGTMISELSLSKAEAAVGLKLENGEPVSVRSFLHAKDNVGMIKVGLPSDSFAIELRNPGFRRPGEPIDFEILRFGPWPLRALEYEPAETGCEGNSRWFVQKIDGDFSYGIFLASTCRNDITEIAYTVATSRDGKEWRERAQALVNGYVSEGYDAAFPGHAAWWAKFWNRSAVSVPDPAFERQWYRSNYLFACCSRKGSPPMPLQGVWSADDGNLPPWKGEYALDLNLQFSYTHYLKANHIAEGESMIDFLWELRPKARELARSIFAADGIFLPCCMALNGDPLGGWPMYSFSPANQIWVCQLFERHYRFTGDKAFLREKAYPYLSETAAFILDILETDAMGRYVLPVSSSPEIHDDSPESWLTPNSNYDLSLLIYLFTHLKRMARELENGDEDRWEGILRKLPALAVTDSGVLMLSPDERLNESHRHLSHAMAIYPLRLLDRDRPENRQVIDRTLEDLVRLGKSMWVGFSFSWMAELYAIQRNGEGAAFHLELLWDTLFSPNGFHLNGDYRKKGITVYDYRPFTIETNMSALDAFQEMLLQTEGGTIEVFPAIPDEWKRKCISFKNFRGERGILISARLANRKVRSITLKPTYSGEYILVNSFGSNSIFLDAPCAIVAGDDRYILTLETGRTYRITPVYPAEPGER